MSNTEPFDSVFTLSSQFKDNFKVENTNSKKSSEGALVENLLEKAFELDLIISTEKKKKKDFLQGHVPNLRVAKQIKGEHIREEDPLTMGTLTIEKGDKEEAPVGEDRMIKDIRVEAKDSLIKKDGQSRFKSRRRKKVTVAFGKTEGEAKEEPLENRIDVEEVDAKTFEEVNRGILKNPDILNPNKLYGQEHADPSRRSNREEVFTDPQNIIYFPTDLLLSLYCQEKGMPVPEFEKDSQKHDLLNSVLKKHKITKKTYKSGKVLFVFLSHKFELLHVKVKGQMQQIYVLKNKKSLSIENQKIKNLYVASLSLD